MTSTRLLIALLAPLILGAPACTCLKTDAQRAKAEREQVEKELRESLSLFPYRFIKMVVRSSKSPGRPAALDGLVALIDEAQALPQKPATAQELAKEAAVWARLAKAIYDARSTMMERDEDEFPTFTELVLEARPPPPFDAQLEHLALAALWFVVDSADRSHRVPGGTEYVFYEVMRAQPQPSWPADARALALLLRGGAYCATDKHYAAEEELTTAIAFFETADPKAFVGWGEQVSPERAVRGLKAAAFFLRAWNRMGLKRDDAAADDLEAGLVELQALGVENELTQWAWSFVHARRGRYEDAATQMEALSKSPNLDSETREELARAASEMRKHGKGIPVLLQSRALVIIAQALLARAGGVENLLRVALGEERARRIGAPIVWLQRARENLASSPSQLVDQGKSLGAKGLELVKQRVDAVRAQDAGVASP